MTSRFSNPSLREVSNVNNLDAKERMRMYAPVTAESRTATSLSSRFQMGRRDSAPSSQSNSRANSPRVDAKHANEPARCADIASDIVDMFLVREKQLARDANYLRSHKEINEKMRTILVDWLVDVHLKFKLHEETFFLAVDIVDRYLSVARVARSQLQLVGITAILLAAKYEEIWPPEVKDCVHIAAKTYKDDEILRMERAICAALQFKFTVPTPFAFLARLLEVTEADDVTKHTAFFYLEHAVLDYGHLQFLPSQLANASFYLANCMLKKPDPWSTTAAYYSKSSLDEFKMCAQHVLDFAVDTTNSKYQAIRRKYSHEKYKEVSRMVFPTEI